MADREGGKFQGIAVYHNGMMVSDYVNMIPRGETCTDRQGEERVDSTLINSPYTVRGHFIDSSGNVYLAIKNKIHRFTYDRVTDSITYAGIMGGYVGGTHVNEFELVMLDTPVSFCESSTKPAQIYFCDGRYIYWWGVDDNPDLDVTRQAFQIGMLWSPNVVLNGITPELQPDQYYKILNPSDGRLSISDIAYIDHIDWFDNKLIAVEKSKNTVWLTCTDPGQFFRNTSKNPFDDADGADLWHNWYASTSSADRLVSAVSFGGQLYFLNDKSIEVWGRTGNEDAPIQSNTTQVIHHGARNPVIIADVLYVIANDQIGGEYIAALSGGQFARVSNPEIDRHLNKPVDLQILAQREETFLFVRLDEATGEGFVFGEGRWWHWVDDRTSTHHIRASIIGDIAVTDRGMFVRFSENTRRDASGKLITRYVRDSFANFDVRKIVRRVALVMDSGVKQVPIKPIDNRDIYLKVSLNRGMSFSQPHYRKLGLSGQNNKVVEWRNLGSSNSLLVEFGTSAEYVLQIYDVKIDLQ